MLHPAPIPDIANIPAIVLAGGFGTRLRSVINHLPKPMADVNGFPFLHYLFLYLRKQGVRKVILSVGYQADIIEEHFGEWYMDISIAYSREETPLGTGGGIKQALGLVTDYAFVLNGDTFFDVDLDKLKDFYFETQADVALALKHMTNFDRYGTVQVEGETITSFDEKKYVAAGMINGGIYFLQKVALDKVTSAIFSFEKDFLEKYVGYGQLKGLVFDGYFIDIGIPEDYTRAKEDFKKLFDEVE